MGKLSKVKGDRFENRLARWMNVFTGAKTSESPSQAWKREIRETQQGNMGDVVDTTGVWPLILEGKHRKAPSPWKALQQVKEAALEYHGREALGVAMIRRQGGEDLVIMTPHLFATMTAMIDSVYTTPGRTMRHFLDRIEELGAARW